MSHLWVNDSGVHFSPKLSQFLRYSSQPMLRFRQLTDKKEAFGKGHGDSYNFDKVANVSTIGGLLVETNTMNRSAQSITKGTLTLNEYGNSIAYTFKIDALSQFDLENIIRKGLRDDHVKVMDAAVESEFNQVQLRFVGTATDGHALTTNGTATATNTSVLNERHIRKMKLELEKRNVPKLDGDSYVGIFSLEAVEGLEGAMVSVNQYTEAGYTKILNGEQGMIHGVRIVPENNATRNTYDLTNRTTTAVAWTGGSNPGYIVGMDMVQEAVAVPTEIRAKEVTDFGRSHGLAWYEIAGFKITWNDAPNAKGIKWDSAA